jgi:hypothetical protein
VTAGGAIRWPALPPVADVVVSAYQPRGSTGRAMTCSPGRQRGWDQVRPEGTSRRENHLQRPARATTAPQLLPPMRPAATRRPVQEPAR